MKTLPVQKTEAIVLGHHPLGETDRIVIFYTRDFGSIRAVARGCRRIKSRLCGRLEILIHGALVFFERVDKDLHVVNSFDIIEPFQVLREDLLKTAYCSYFSELIQHIESPGVADVNTFDLMLGIMALMKTSDDPETLARTFEIRLLANAGFSPQLDSCVVCSNDVGASPGFDVARGGVLCSKCKHESSVIRQGPIIPVSRGAVELIRHMQRTPLELIPRLKISKASKSELRKAFKSFISFHAGIGRLRSLDFLMSIENDKELSVVASQSSDETS